MHVVISSHIPSAQLQVLSQPCTQVRPLHVWKININALLNCRCRYGSQQLKTWFKGVYRVIVARSKVNVKIMKMILVLQFCIQSGGVQAAQAAALLKCLWVTQLPTTFGWQSTSFLHCFQQDYPYARTTNQCYKLYI